MSPKKILAIVLLAAGVLCLVYKGFTYTKETHDAKLGPIEFSVKEKEHVDLPMWLGVGLVVVGGALLVVGRDK
jgi:drug/metabolite transporter (DMT)-like permease